VAWSGDSRRLAVLRPQSLELWNVEDQRRLWQQPLDEGAATLHVTEAHVVADSDHFDILSGASSLAIPPLTNVLRFRFNNNTALVHVCPDDVAWSIDVLFRIGELSGAIDRADQRFRFAISGDCTQLARRPAAHTTSVWSLPDAKPLVELALIDSGRVLIARETDVPPRQPSKGDEPAPDPAHDWDVVPRTSGRFVLAGDLAQGDVFCNVGDLPLPTEACAAASIGNLLSTLAPP
jgi:hypothetical protein